MCPVTWRPARRAAGSIRAVGRPASSAGLTVPSGARSTNCTEVKLPARVTTANSLRNEALVNVARSENVDEMALASPASSCWEFTMMARRMST